MPTTCTNLIAGATSDFARLFGRYSLFTLDFLGVLTMLVIDSSSDPYPLSGTWCCEVLAGLSYRDLFRGTDEPLPLERDVLNVFLGLRSGSGTTRMGSISVGVSRILTSSRDTLTRI
jgi:hypothetical protein